MLLNCDGIMKPDEVISVLNRQCDDTENILFVVSDWDWEPLSKWTWVDVVEPIIQLYMKITNGCRWRIKKPQSSSTIETSTSITVYAMLRIFMVSLRMIKDIVVENLISNMKSGVNYWILWCTSEMIGWTKTHLKASYNCQPTRTYRLYWSFF